MALPSKKKQRLGDLFVEQGLITPHQLKDALKRQAQVGGQIGSVLVEMGVISTDTLLNFLSQQLGIPSVNLFKIDISPDILKLMPVEKIKAMKVLPISLDESSITLAMVNPRDMLSISDIEFSLGKKVHPVVVPASQMEAAISSLTQHPEKILSGQTLETESQKAETKKAPPLTSLLKFLSRSPAADMLLTAGAPPSIKLINELQRAAMGPLTPADCEKYARELIPEKDWDTFMQEGDRDFAITITELGRFRISCYKQRNSISITIRLIPDILPSPEELNLPEWIKEYLLMPQGLILVSGPDGQGKSTSVAAMIDFINSSRKCNIVTFEDPVEYLHKHKKSNVNQRNIGEDTKSFAGGLRHVFRQNPDVIMIDEIRDAATFALALQAADTGHLVIASVHASTAQSTVESVINLFPPEQENIIRTKVADNLLFVLSQRLIPLKTGDGRVLGIEKLENSFRIKNIIRESKTNQIKTQKLAGSDDFTPLETSLAKLYSSGLIKNEDALLFAENKQLYKDLTK